MRVKDWRRDGAPFRSNIGMGRNPYIKGGKCAHEKRQQTILRGPQGGQYYIGTRGTKVYCRNVQQKSTKYTSKAATKPTVSASTLPKGYQMDGYEVVMRRKGAGYTKTWRKI